MRSPPLALLLLLVVGLLACAAHAQMGKFGSKEKEAKAPAVHSDIPYIRCQVCEKMVKQAILGTSELKAKADEKPGNKLTEESIIDMLEKMCDPEKDPGEWVSKIDLQEEGDTLKLVDMGEVGVCNSECRTVARACEQMMDKLDLSDMSELLYAGAKRSTLTNWACYEQGSSCRTKAPPLPEDRAPGPTFQAMSEDEVRNKKLMRTMKEAGLSGEMYDRDSMMAKMAGGGMGGGDEYGDDYGGDDYGGGDYGGDYGGEEEEEGEDQDGMASDEL